MKLRNILSRIKNGLVLDAILWRLEWLGILIEPYYIIQEVKISGQASTWGGFDAYKICFLGKYDMEEIVVINEGRFCLDKLNQRLERGDLCYGLRKEGKIVAYMWCDLKVFNHAPCRYDLSDNEVYLYDARVSPDCRGKGIAPFLRVQCYDALGQYSKDTFLSVSNYSNTPAVRFKKKLGARFLKLCLYVKLWGKYSQNWVLRDYFPKRENTAAKSSISDHED